MNRVVPVGESFQERRVGASDGLDEVYALVNRGFRVIPVGRGAKYPLAGNDWPAKATRDPATIESWHLQHGNCNWAVTTGVGSGTFVIDVDGPEGEETMRALCAEHSGSIPPTLTCITGRGRHLYFRTPEGIEIGNLKLSLKIDVKGERGYVVAPPSIHESGHRYRFENREGPLAECPDWLLQTMRNNWLFNKAFGQRCRGGEYQNIYKSLRRVNASRCRPPLPAEEVAKISASACRYPVGSDDRSLSLDDAVRVAMIFNETGYVAATKRYRSPLFIFTRRLKGRREFIGLDGITAARQLDRVLSSLANMNTDPWDYLFGQLNEDSRALFIRTWDEVMIPESASPLHRAYEASCSQPLIPINSSSPMYNKVISLIWHLQRQSPSQPVFLSQKKIGELVGRSQEMVSVYLRTAMKEGLLVRVGQYSFTRSIAAEYNFRIDRFDWNTGNELLPAPRLPGAMTAW